MSRYSISSMMNRFNMASSFAIPGCRTSFPDRGGVVLIFNRPDGNGVMGDGSCILLFNDRREHLREQGVILGDLASGMRF